MGAGKVAPAALPRQPSLPTEAGRQLTLRIDPFPALFNVGLRWGGSAYDLREELEAELGKTLPTAATRDNPTAGWLFTAAGMVFFLLVFGFLLIFLLAYWRGGQ